MDWCQSQLAWVHIGGGGRVNLFTTKLGSIISPSFWGTKSLEATILYNDS